jgi:hypothetical protein
MCKECAAFSRRDLLAGAAGVPAVTRLAMPLAASPGEVLAMRRLGKPLRVKPSIVYQIFTRKEGNTWREWGGLATEADVDQEIRRIEEEHKVLSSQARFPVEFLPIERVNADPVATRVAAADCDVHLVYAAGGAGAGIYKQTRLDAITGTGKPSIIFLRHRSGPFYNWYEIVHVRLLRNQTDKYTHPSLTVWDVVVDDPGGILWRLRALYGLKNTMGTRIVAVNGAGTWGGGAPAVERAIGLWKLDVRTVPMEQLKSRLEARAADSAAAERAGREARAYVSQKSVVEARTGEPFIVRSFLLKDVLLELMRENSADAVTIRGCMGIGPIAQTTACLAFSLINDEGPMAWCESDFPAIGAGILLHHISGKPVFLNDPCFPHNGIVTCAHCTSPRRMDGRDLEPVRILTHFDSDYGAAPKVEFRKGQVITNLVPDFKTEKWLGFRATITDHPFYPICRSQFDCAIDGDWHKVLEEMRGFHWVTVYDDYLREIGYAARKVGIGWVDASGGRA